MEGESRRDSWIERYGDLATASVIAAHANAKAEGFRQKDVKFMLDLLCNWLESSLGLSKIKIQNVQILRFLQSLVGEGYVKVKGKRQQSFYRLTRGGFVSLIERVVSLERALTPEEFFFTFYFIESYKEKILEMIDLEGKEYPYSMKLEVNELLNTKTLLEREIKRTKKIIKELEAVIFDARGAAELTRTCLKKNVPYNEIVKKWELQFPYGLNSQRPLSELFKEISPDIAKWEFEKGNMQRVTLLWEPIRIMKEGYLSQLLDIEGRARTKN